MLQIPAKWFIMIGNERQLSTDRIFLLPVEQPHKLVVSRVPLLTLPARVLLLSWRSATGLGGLTKGLYFLH